MKCPRTADWYTFQETSRATSVLKVFKNYEKPKQWQIYVVENMGWNDDDRFSGLNIFAIARISKNSRSILCYVFEKKAHWFTRLTCVKHNDVIWDWMFLTPIFDKISNKQKRSLTRCWSFTVRKYPQSWNQNCKRKFCKHF